MNEAWVVAETSGISKNKKDNVKKANRNLFLNRILFELIYIIGASLFALDTYKEKGAY